ncbi:hypothetical protein VNI00_000844 [Paramarasmius palmivorus]|uniref:Uncharacterized protein n=1 Tax=Paramarasmius palmivorus TaxID=297713 RepID=A0AAW0EC52_9AGAR
MVSSSPLPSPLLQDDSDDDFDWEEVQVPAPEPVLEVESPPEEEKHIEIIISKQPTKKEKDQTKVLNHAARLMRIDVHKVHTITLLLNAGVRNRWLNDELLQARLLSLIPLPLQNSFAMIHPRRVPEVAMRGRMFESALGRLVEWWCGEYFLVDVEKGAGMRNRPFEDVQKGLEKCGYRPKTEKSVEEFIKTTKPLIDDDDIEDILGIEELEVIRTEKSLMKHALMAEGSRDVVFLGPAEKKVYPRRNKAKKGAVEEEQVASGSSTRTGTPFSASGEAFRLDGAPVQKSEKAKGKEKAVDIKLRKQKHKGQVLGKKPKPKAKPFGIISVRTLSTVTDLCHIQTHSTRHQYFGRKFFPSLTPRWIPVDPIRGIVNKRSAFDPGKSTDNKMLYVMAFEEDGYARDVTRRYAKDYSAKVSSFLVSSGHFVLKIYSRSRSYAAKATEQLGGLRLSRVLRMMSWIILKLMEGLPTSLAGFKDHPLYVLERHLNQTQAIFPPPPETLPVAHFRGDPVYSRSSVVSLKSAENWMRSEGRIVKEGEVPIKEVKVKASTVNRQRELEVLREAGANGSGANDKGKGHEAMQGLYARRQTEVYVPPPNYRRHSAKIARKLGVDFAEAVTGFEFRKRRATPVLQGVVVAAEHENTVLEAYYEAERDATEKARRKKEEQVIKMWTRVIHGLKVRKRLLEQYQKEGREPAAASEIDGSASRHDDGQPGSEAGPSGGGFCFPNRVSFLDKDLIDREMDEEPILVDDGADLPDRMAFATETMDIDEVDTIASRPLQELPVSIKSMSELALTENAPPLSDDKGHDSGRASGPTNGESGQVTGGTPNGKARRASTRKRKRAQDVEEDHSEGEPTPIPVRTVASSTRVLRPRRGKTQVQREEEQQRERALKELIGE